MEKWQEALERWDKWISSQKKAVAKINRKYADELCLIRDAKIVVEDAPENSTGCLIRINESQSLKWEIETEVERIAAKFVTSQMGLRLGSDVHTLFVDHWINTASPVLTRELKLSHQDDLMPEPSYIEVNITKDKKAKDRIKYNVSWYGDETDHHEVAKALDRIPYSLDVLFEKSRHAGGRPKEVERIIPEAIVCYLLKHKQKMAHKEIASIFGWKTYTDSNGNLMSNTARNRIKLGAQILKGAKGKVQ